MSIVQDDLKTRISSIIIHSAQSMASLDEDLSAIHVILQDSFSPTNLLETEEKEQLLKLLMPYKNSLDSIYKSLYDLKLKALMELKDFYTTETQV